jgi:hypothetical protein
MASTISLRPIQTGDACYLTDHHNRDGECIITVVMHDGCNTAYGAYCAMSEEISGIGPRPRTIHGGDLVDVANWCLDQWLLAQADMPAETDRDTVGGDQSERYLECHILASWEV